MYGVPTMTVPMIAYAVMQVRPTLCVQFSHNDIVSGMFLIEFPAIVECQRWTIRLLSVL